MSFKSPLRAFPGIRAGRDAALGLTPAFVPTDLTGLILWLRDTGTYQDAAKTTAADADGDVIGAWEDQSGNGNDVTQATTANKPTLKLNIQNGRSVARFDGGDYLFRTDALTMSGSDKPMTAFIVGEADSFAANRTLLAFGNSSNGTPIWRVVFNATPNYFVQRRDDASFSANFAAGTPVANTWYIYTVVFSGTTVTVRSNGATQGAPNSAMNTGVLTLDRCAVGALVRTTVAQQHLGDIGEVVVYDSALAQADYEQVEQYLATRWGITLP